MNIKIAILALLFPFAAQAASAIKLTCVTNPPSTSFGITTDGDKVKGTVVFHYGPQFAPVIHGIYTPNDIKILSERAELVKKMKDITTFTWPLEKCRRHDESRFECFGPSDVQEGKNGEKIFASALYTTRKQMDGIAGKYSVLNVNLSLNVDGRGDVYVSMDYPALDCRPTRSGGL